MEIKNKSILPYWDQNIDLDIVNWLPYEKDYSPVSVNRIYSPVLGKISSLAMELSSEFLYLHSLQYGNVGTMFRQNMIDPQNNRIVELGFSAVFSYSNEMEKGLLPLIAEFKGLRIAITMCCIWNKGILTDQIKVIMIINENPFFDENSFLNSMIKQFMSELHRKKENIAYFAEKFGYRRFSIPYETENLTGMRITQILFDLETEEAKELLGPTPELTLAKTAGI